jgi:CRISPR-associated protein (TIGR02584 family)
MQRKITMHKQPHEYTNRILIAVSGLSPQIITETIYALATQEVPFVPTEIHVFTTQEGFDRARLTLLGEIGDKSGWLARLRQDYQLPEIKFDESCIHVLKDEQQNALSDIRTEHDNMLLADLITQTMQAIINQYETSGEDCALHVSIAGGRKTMGYYVGYALSLLGRAQDRLSHVLVSENYEGHPEFFYPTPYSKVITTRDSKPLDTKEAQVSLAYIPFVRLRNELPRQLISEQISFSDLIENAQKAISGQLSLEINLKELTIIASGKVVKLAPIDFSFYLMFAEHAFRGNASGYHVSINDKQMTKEFLALYAGIVGKHSGDFEHVEKSLIHDIDKSYFERRLTNIKKGFITAMGKEGSIPYLPKQVKGNKIKPYQITLTAEKITILS